MLNTPPCFILRIAHLPKALHASAITLTRNDRIHKRTGTISFHYPTYKVAFQNRLNITYHIEPLVDPHS